jgi:hypothetical protein
MVEREEIMKEKVYCKDCVYFEKLPIYYKLFRVEIDACNYPENITYMDTYKEKLKTHHQIPSIINENNDCEWFEKETIPHPPKGGTGQN